MSYSLYKKLGGMDEELIKTNMTISGIVGGEPIPSKGGCFDGVHHQEQNISNYFLSSARELQLNSRARLDPCQSVCSFQSALVPHLVGGQRSGDHSHTLIGPCCHGQCSFNRGA